MLFSEKSAPRTPLVQSPSDENWTKIPSDSFEFGRQPDDTLHPHIGHVRKADVDFKKVNAFVVEFNVAHQARITLETHLGGRELLDKLSS